MTDYINKNAVVNLILAVNKAESRRADLVERLLDGVGNMHSDFGITDDQMAVQYANRVTFLKQVLLDSPVAFKALQCDHCGQEVRAEDKFCKGCGRAFNPGFVDELEQEAGA